MFDSLKKTFDKYRYENAKKKLQSSNATERKNIAKNSKTPPEILFYLAVDPDVEVRKELTENSETPIHAAKILANDPETAVRENLAKRLDRILPDMNNTEKTKVNQIANEVLSTLVRDEVVKVRKAVADVVKDMTGIPHHIIKTLAEDTELDISMPILQDSPLLTDEDLIEIITHHPESQKITAIAKRANVSENVSDVIANTKNIDAVSALLENSMAQIREETLDLIINQAPEIHDWQRPLVTRPELPSQAVGKLIEFVADGLLTELETHQKISPEHRQKIQGRIKKVAEDRSNQKEYIELLKKNPQEWAELMQRQGKLTEELLTEQIQHNYKEAVIAGISLLSKVPVFVLNYAFASGNAKLVSSVCWKSGMSMQFSYHMQKNICKIPDYGLIAPTEEGFPFSVEEMETELRSLYK